MRKGWPGLLMLVATAALGSETLHVYHIGNSLTRGIVLARLHELFASQDVDYQFGSQLAAGCTLDRHVRFRELGFKTNHQETNVPAGETFEPGGPDFDPNPKRFGPWDQALAEHRWDAVVLQPFRSHLADDLPAARHLIRYAAEHQAASHFYLYTTWPRREVVKQGDQTVPQAIDYAALWTQPYESGPTDRPKNDASFHSRAYYERLRAALVAELPRPDLEVDLIPAGEVLYLLDQRIKAGEVPGLEAAWKRDPKLVPGWDVRVGHAAGANVLYADAIHLNPLPHQDPNIGSYAVALTFVATLTGKSPLGLSAAAYGFDETADAALVHAIQTAVRDVVAPRD